MMLKHKFYFFDSASFIRGFTEEIVTDSGVRDIVLYNKASELVKNGSSTLKETLDFLTYDEDWLDTSDTEVSRGNFLFMILLANLLKPVSDDYLVHSIRYASVVDFLLKEKWSKEDSYLLVHGQPLQSLLKSFKNELLEWYFMGVDQSGSWIPLEKCKILLSLLTKTFESLGLSKEPKPHPVDYTSKRVVEEWFIYFLTYMYKFLYYCVKNEVDLFIAIEQ